jgi:hypothetical protein
MFFKLRNSESAVDKKMAENLKRKEVYYALIQVVKDPQNTAVEGQIKVFKFGWKLKQKIDEMLNPKFDEPTQIFDPFEGKNFELNIIKKGGFPNYDGCKFQGKTIPMVLNGKQVKNDDDSRKAIIDYLKGAPELDKWDYTPWTDDDRSRVVNALSQYTSPGSSIASVTRSTAASRPAPEVVAERKAKPQQEPEPVMESSASDDNLDDFLDGLDL